jgi:hypothetical protein
VTRRPSGPAPARPRLRFRGRIAGVGSASGVRVVVGRWDATPLGSFGDAMVERPDGHRVLLAPSEEVADFIAATYTFDEVRIEPFAVTGSATVWQVRSASLDLDLTTGRRTALGVLLRLVPDRVATATWWCSLTDLVARVVLRGVRTRGDTGERREWYGALDHHAVVAAGGTFEGADLGALAPVTPPPRFGFSSTPARPSVTRVVTTVEVSDPPAERP